MVYHGDYNAFKAHHFTDRNDPNLNKNIVLLAFNWTGSSPSETLSFKSKVEDLIETFYQLKDSGQLQGYGLYEYLKVWLTQDPNAPAKDILFDKIDDIVSTYSRAVEGANLVEMIEQYEKISLKQSHRVLLVAHSQGNLFGNEVYDNLIEWEKTYFLMVSVATPADNVLGKDSPYTTLKCDKVINDNRLGGVPGHLPGNVECTGEEQSSDRHKFIENYLSNHLSLHKILSDLTHSQESLDNTPSQWATDQVFNEGTCDYRITVKHRFDPSIEIGEKVYPFAPDKKLYPVKGEYVKATCGGQNILGKGHKVTTWEGKRDDECYMIDNPPHEKITTVSGKFLPGHNYSDFLPQGLGAPVGTIDDSTGCATIHVPEGYLTFYRLKGSQGRAECVPDYQFGYREGQIYTCLPANYFEMIGSIRISDFLRQAKYNGVIDICGGSNSSWSRK